MVVGDRLFMNSYWKFTELLSANLSIQGDAALNLKEYGIIWRVIPLTKAVMKMRNLNLDKTCVSCDGGAHTFAALLYSLFMTPPAKLCRGFSAITSF